MKKSLLLLLMIPFVAAIALPARILFHSDTYNVDVKKSKIEWLAKKVTGKHTGEISISNGKIVNNHGQLTGQFLIDMNSIVVTDLTDSKKTKLETHLKSEDFFSVAKHPVSSFEITSVVPKAGGKPEDPNFVVTGKLTIKGITNEISFPALIKFDGSQMSAKAEVNVDRSKFDIRYGSKSFYNDIGDKAIDDIFTLTLDVVASK